MTFKCPSCQSRAVGRVGSGLFYCWDCCIEFSPTNNGWQMFQLQDDGTQVPMTLDATAHASVKP
jgi:ribosomal protein L37AE/L43A